jgi:hypothetical protein
VSEDSERTEEGKDGAQCKEHLKDDVVSFDLGKRKIDFEGSPVSGSSMDVSRAYAGVLALLQEVINE